MADKRITKRKVTMTRFGVNSDGQVLKIEAVDYVPDDVREGVNVLEAYLAAVRPHYDRVEVSEDYDAGPGGYEGQTAIPAGINHPAAGVVYPAIEKDGEK